MTGNVSQAGETLPFPATCPKCGQALSRGTTEGHFRIVHPKSIGTATLKLDVAVVKAFAYVRPVEQETGSWWVVWIDFPFEVAKLRSDRWFIAWGETP